jgi:hypothetical protein
LLPAVNAALTEGQNVLVWPLLHQQAVHYRSHCVMHALCMKLSCVKNLSTCTRNCFESSTYHKV